MELKVHPAANLFPLMNESELRELAKDIRTHGQKEPCVFYQDQLLDGRNRWRACQLLGTEPEFRIIDGYKGFDPLKFVLSTNLHRRHLSGSQRAMIAARARSVYQARAKQRRRDGGKAAGRGRPQSNKKKDGEILPEPIAGRARDQAGATLGVSGKSVDQATTVLVKGSRELQQAVDAENASQAVKDEVSRKITDWQSRLSLSLSKESLDSLTWDIVSLVDDLIHAALNNPEAFRTRPKGQARR